MVIPVQFDLKSIKPCPWIKSISGTIGWFGTGLECHYRITGDWNHLHWPDLNPVPGRRGELWLDTCCELFISTSGQPGYLELNFSPSGDWNCYGFSDYRSGMRESHGYTIENLICTQSSAATRILKVTLVSSDQGNPVNGPLANASPEPNLCITTPLKEIGIAAVMKGSTTRARSAPGSDLYYYSLAPRTGTADFHDRTGFRIKLECCQ